MSRERASGTDDAEEIAAVDREVVGELQLAHLELARPPGEPA